MKKVINMTMVEAHRQDAQELICEVAHIGVLALSGLLLAGGIILPLVAPEITPVHCWLAMAAEPAAYGCYRLAAWVRRYAL